MPLMTLEMYCLTGYPFAEGQLVEHGDLLSELKRVQEGLLGGFERELTTPNTLSISQSYHERNVVASLIPFRIITDLNFTNVVTLRKDIVDVVSLIGISLVKVSIHTLATWNL